LVTAIRNTPPTTLTGEFYLYPNPVKNGTKLTYELKRAGEVFIDIQDLSGTKIARVFNGLKSAGKHELILPQSVISQLQGKKGTFLLSLRTSNELKTIKFIL
jgi:hypothetical protein